MSRSLRVRPSTRAAAAALVGALLVSAATGAAKGREPAATPPPPTAAAGELPGPDPLLRELIGFKVRYRDLLRRNVQLVRWVSVPYRAWNGAVRHAVLVLPKWYGPKTHPPIPLVISPHGRGGTADANAALWGGLPAFGPFAVVNPEGQGRKLTAYSWGWRGQIADLARMPNILEAALPWFHVDRTRVYAIGSSMGGQETLLLAALYPKLLTAAAPLDSATDMAARYRAFATVPSERGLQRLARDRDRRHPDQQPEGVRSPQPDHLRQAACNRRRPDRHLVEPQGQDRRRPEPGIRSPLPGDQAPEPEGPRRAVRRHLGSQPRDAPACAASARTRRPQDRRARRAALEDRQTLESSPTPKRGNPPPAAQDRGRATGRSSEGGVSWEPPRMSVNLLRRTSSCEVAGSNLLRARAIC